MTKDDAAPGQIIGRHFDGDGIACQDTNEVHPHLSGNMRNNLVSVFEFNLEYRIRQGIGHFGLQSYRLFFRHVVVSLAYASSQLPGSPVQ